eukprot:5540199-Amphidinium_carterae.1
MPMDIDNPDIAAHQPELPVQGGDTMVDADKDVETTGAYKPTRRLVGKQSPPQPGQSLHNWTTSRTQRRSDSI